jgi:C4-dicarboxylate-binding protein DctP
LEKLSDGEIDVKIFTDSTLYKKNEELTALKLNDIQMAIPELSYFTDDIPKLKLFELPFLFKNISDVISAENSKLGREIKSLSANKGYMALDFLGGSFKQLSSNKKPILLPTDIKNRVVCVNSLSSFTNKLTSKVTLVEKSQTYSSIIDNKIPYSENKISQLYNDKLYEIEKSLTISQHTYSGNMIAINSSFYDLLPRKLQEKLMQAINETVKMEHKLNKQIQKNYLDKIKKYAKETNKFEIFKLTPSQKKVWKKFAKSIQDDFYLEHNISKNDLN